jgi:periplasmic protein CpxP/Spy
MRSRLIAGIAAVVLAVAGTFVAAGSVVHAQRAHEGRFGGGAFGGGPFAGGFGPGRGMVMGALRQLNLTDQQKEQVRGIFQSHRADFQQVREKLRTAFEAQRAAAEATPVDEATVRAKANDIAAAQADMVVLTAKVRAEVFQLLTPEQQAKAQELKAQREQRRQERLQQRQQQRQQNQQQPPAQK